MMRLLTAIFLLATPLKAADVAREVPGAGALALALPPMNLGVEFAPMAGDAFSGGAYSLTPAAPMLLRPAALSPAGFSSMPLNPTLPMTSPTQWEGANVGQVIPGRAAVSQSELNLSERLKKQALGLQLPLKNLASWSLGGAKNSAEKGRGLSDDLWRLLFSAHPQDQGALGQTLSDGRSGENLGSGAISFPAQTGLSRDSSQGHDPVVAGIGPIPAPDASLADIEIFKENNRLNRENTLSLKEDHFEFILSSIRQISGPAFFAREARACRTIFRKYVMVRPPALIFMRVARRLLDFTLFEKIGTIYRLIAPVQGRDDLARWEFFEPASHAQQRKEQGMFSSFRRRPESSGGISEGLDPGLRIAGVTSDMIVPGLFSLPNASANLWLFLSFLPIFIAAFAYRRSFQ